jgi:hypothetical protein
MITEECPIVNPTFHWKTDIYPEKQRNFRCAIENAGKLQNESVSVFTCSFEEEYQ